MAINKIICSLVLLSLTLGQSFAQQEETSYIDLRVIPVGSIPLAKFGSQPPPEKPDEDLKQPPNKDPSKKTLPQKKSGVTVINLPEDERPIGNLYIKRQGAYYAINCQQNRIGAPYRIFYDEPTIIFYKKRRSADGSESFKEVFTYVVKPSQKNILVTLSKPLDEKKWTDPIVKTYNLTHLKNNHIPLTIVNTSSRYNLGLKLNNKSSVIKPYGVSSPRSGSSKHFTMQIAASPDLKRWSKLQRLTLQNSESMSNLVITYEVWRKESPRGFKIIRGKIKHGKFRKPRKVSN